MDGLGPEPIRAVFIRAPWIEDHGPAVEVLADVDGHPVAVREGEVLLCAFHPELTDDSRVHALLMAMATAAGAPASGGAAGGRPMRDPRVDNLARILVRYSTEVKEGDTCVIEGPTAGEPLIAAVYEEVLRRAGYPIVALSLEGQLADLLRARLRRPARVGLAARRVGRRGGGLPDRDRRRHQHPRALRRRPRAPDEAAGGEHAR